MTLLPIGSWPETLLRALETHPAVARVVIAGARGSAPREPGASMLVTESAFFGTIGGGQLEWKAVSAARALLHPAQPAALTQRFALAADLGQCCGGVVELWLERYTAADRALIAATADAARRSDPAALECTLDPSGLTRRLILSKDLDAEGSYGVAQFLDQPNRLTVAALRRDGDTVKLLERLEDASPSVWLYGAGHVGQALARILATLPLRLTWIDPRHEFAPKAGLDRPRLYCVDDPPATVASAPRGAYYLVMTHSHALDYELCRGIVQRTDLRWAGVIGSKSKAARFRSRLRRDGLDAGSIARLACPIGVAGIVNKAPAAIAVSVAAQILQLIEADAGADERVDANPSDPRAAACATCRSCSDAIVSTPALEKTGV